ncbi:acyltransferase family protein [Belnapia rosea]|uniref:acyltransferase family protein n=1 Tax=Belnapia rosea TaxID=938405 RepID=UPI00088A53B1|nr:acyltransferase [Belnapia rosea]SDB56112.1 Acyltransferase family protein [Belnapia rosea]
MPDQTVGTAGAAVRPARRLDLDRARGIAILLVVFGHVVAQQVPPGVEWYEPIRYLLYRFHMPFFLYLSGTVVVLSGLLAKPPGRVVRQRAERLLVPFFGIGLLILAAKLIALQLVHVDNPPEGLAGGLRDLFWTTRHSPATSVWYLLVLFLCTLVAMGLRRVGVGATGLVALGVALQFLDVPPVAYLDRFASHFLFFAAGLWVAEREDGLLPAFERWQPGWWVAFAAGLALAALGWIGPRWSMVLCGLLCIPALHGAMRVAPIARWHWPLVLGSFSMAIYLFNTLAIGGTKAVLMKAGIGWTEAWFPLHVVAAMVAGVVLPVLLKVLVLRRVPAVDRLTD